MPTRAADPNLVTASELAGAAARAGGEVRYHLGDLHGGEDAAPSDDTPSARVVTKDGWGAARLLSELSTIDSTKPAVRAASQALTDGIDMASDVGKEIYTRRVQTFVKRAIIFAREEGEIFQSSSYTARVGYGDCDDHARVVVALLRAQGIRATLGLLHSPGGGPRHVAAVAHLPTRGATWLETTCDAAFGEHPLAAAARLGVLRPDILSSGTIRSTILPADAVLPPSASVTGAGTMASLTTSFLGTKQSVLDAFIPFTAKFEGSVSFMYLDVRGLVTTGIGNLIDPISLALSLPWRHTDGSLASRSEVIDTWNLVKSHTEMAKGGGVAFGRIPGNDLHLDADGIAEVVSQRFNENERILRAQFPQFDQWPADAQLALHSLAWARGPANFAGGFPRLTAALQRQDFRAAADQSHLNGNTTGRNDADRALFIAAADAAANGDPEAIHIPIPGAVNTVNGAGIAGGANKLATTLLVLAIGGALVHYIDPRLLPSAAKRATSVASSLVGDVRRAIRV